MASALPVRLPTRFTAGATIALARLREDPVRALTLLVVILAAVPRLWAMWFDQGVFWPDEIYQSIEQGHRLAFGNGFVPWEFEKGVRSYVFPGVLAVVLKIASLLGAHSGEGLVKTAKTFMVVLALWGVASGMQLGRRIGGAYGVLLAGTFAALFPASIVYGSRCMGEMASGPLLISAAVLVTDGGRKRMLWAGALAGTAIYIRYQNGLLAVAFLLVPLFSRRFKDTFWYALSACVFGIAGGMLDWATWGKPFNSFIEYYKFNVQEGKASQWGTADGYYYFHCFWDSTGGVAIVVLAIGLALSFTRVRVLPLAVAAYVAGHVMIPHKEYRFLMPVIPLALALSGGGLGWLLERLSGSARDSSAPAAPVAVDGRGARMTRVVGHLATAIAVVTGILLTHKLLTIRFMDMGQSADVPVGKQPPWHHEEGPNLAFWEAGKDPQLCGIIMVGIPLIGTGAYSYLHKNVPILTHLGTHASANFLAGPLLMVPPSGYRMVKSFPQDNYALFKRPGGCAPPPAWFSQRHF